MKKILAAVGVSLISGVLVYWWSANSGSATLLADGRADGTEKVGNPAPESATTATFGASQASPLYDPVVVGPCNLLPLQEQEISSQLDGLLSELRVDLGHQVAAGDLLARLDDRQLRPQVELLKIRAASLTAERIARAQHDEAESKVAYALKANESGMQSVPPLEYKMYVYQRERFAQEILKAREERDGAAKELERAIAQLDLHQLRSSLAGEIVKVYKRSGEAVKQAEPLFQIANVTKLRVEGLCKVQQAHLLRVGMRALVEPELRGDQMTELVGHTGPITALAMAPDGRLLASASDDRSLMLWSWPNGTRLASLPHPAEVTAVAVAPGTEVGTYRVLTGCTDGRVRLWTVRPGRIEAPLVFADSHEGPIRALAFLPGANSCVSGGEDKRIVRWDVASGKHVGWIHQEIDATRSAHQGAVTSLQATPDDCLVSAGRDNTVKVWNLHESSAQLVASHRGRTGEATQLGVSPNGKTLLFDHGEELRLLDRDQGHALGVLRGRRQGRFQAFALFSPSGRLVLSPANNGRLHLWKTPPSPQQTAQLRTAYLHGFHPGSLLAINSPGPLPVGAALAALNSEAAAEVGAPGLWGLHGFEVRHYQPPNTSSLTCAAFAPDEQVFFTAGADKVIRVWAVPAVRQWNQMLEARLTYVGSQVERGTDLVRIRAEMDNPLDPAERLRPGTYVALRLFPETARDR